MPSYPVNDTFKITYKAAAVIAQHLRVKLTAAGELDVAGDEASIGFAEKAAAIGDWIQVRTTRAPEFNAVASVAIAVGGPVFAAAAGKVAATGTRRIGVARKASTAGDQVILVAPVDVTA